MNRTNLALTFLLCFLAFGYTTNDESGVAKIYLIDSLLVRSDPARDIRLYSIANPSSLELISTINMTGNNDVAISGRYMYADQNENLIVYDILDRRAPVAIDTIRQVFREIWVRPVPMPMMEEQVVGGASGCNSGCNDDVAVSAPARTSTGDFESSTGKGGSLARFAIVGNYLYCIDVSTLAVYDISNPAAPRYKNSVNVGWQIETLFAHENELFIGGQSGMYRYSIASPENPTRLSEFEHRTSCDPVVVEGNRAYVTLRGGTPCGGFGNQLDIIDISNRYNPMLLKTVPLDGPYGLAVRDGNVIICDGASGIKILNTNDLGNIRTVSTITGIVAHDVILHGDLLIVTTTTGIWVYNVARLDTPVRLTEYVF